MVVNRPAPFSPDRASTWPLRPAPPGGAHPYLCHGLTDVVEHTVVVAGGTALVNFTGAAGDCPVAPPARFEERGSPPPPPGSGAIYIYIIINTHSV